MFAKSKHGRSTKLLHGGYNSYRAPIILIGWWYTMVNILLMVVNDDGYYMVNDG